MKIIVPIRTVSELNQREHWGAKASRRKKQREAMLTYLLLNRNDLPEFPVKVTFTRLGKKMLDEGDNLNSSMKAIRDEIADFYGVDDGDPRWEWEYAQRKSKTYEVEVEIEPG